MSLERGGGLSGWIHHLLFFHMLVTIDSFGKMHPSQFDLVISLLGNFVAHQLFTSVIGHCGSLPFE